MENLRERSAVDRQLTGPTKCLNAFFYFRLLTADSRLEVPPTPGHQNDPGLEALGSDRVEERLTTNRRNAPAVKRLLPSGLYRRLRDSTGSCTRETTGARGLSPPVRTWPT